MGTCGNVSDELECGEWITVKNGSGWPQNRWGVRLETVEIVDLWSRSEIRHLYQGWWVSGGGKRDKFDVQGDAARCGDVSPEEGPKGTHRSLT